MAIETRLHKVGDHFSVTIPAEEVKRLGLADGQAVRIEVRAVEVSKALRPEVRDAFDASWQRNEAGYRYLAGR